MSRFKRPGDVDSLAGFRTEKAEPAVPYGLLKAARKNGQLNLSGRGLTQGVPSQSAAGHLTPDRGDQQRKLQVLEGQVDTESVYRLNIDMPEEAENVSFGASDRWWEQTDLVKLLVSSNQLTSLSDDIRLLAGLNILDLHDNQLSSLPSSLGELQELQQLRLSHNCLTSLPVKMFSLMNLRSLTIQQNLLEDLPEELGQLKNLNELDVSNNHLKCLPSSIGCLGRLQKLNLCHNKLCSLPESLGQLTNVKMLDCSNNQLTDSPASLAEMVTLEQLYLRHNKLRLLPHLCAPTFQELYVGNNQIEQLETEKLVCLPAFSFLELRDNKIKTIPEHISSLKTLVHLDLTNNDITTLPASLSRLPSLKVLLLEGNPLRGIRRDLLAKGTNELLKYLRGRIQARPEAADEGRTAMTLPSQAKFSEHNIKTLKLLEFSDRQADKVPDELFDAAVGRGVTAVNFSRNQLKSLPTRLVESHASLADINVGFNQLTCCSPDICQLLQLKHIDLRNNWLDELPSEMKNLTRLCSIILNFNRFKSFPDVLYHIVTLETVLLCNNQVEAVDPGRLMRLDHLSTLDLSNNDLLIIPPELGLCTSLRFLGLDGNPFRTPRPAVLAKGTDAVLEYLRSRIPT